MEGFPIWWIYGIIAVYGLMGLSVVPALAAIGFLLARRPHQALTLFATALLSEAISCAAFCFLMFSLTSTLWGLSLLLAGAGQFVAALRSPRTYALASAFAVGAVVFIVAGTPMGFGVLHRVNLPPDWLNVLLAVTSLLLAMGSLTTAVLLPSGSRQAKAEGAEAKGPGLTSR